MWKSSLLVRKPPAEVSVSPRQTPPPPNRRVLPALAALEKRGARRSHLPGSPHVTALPSVLNSCAGTQASPGWDSASVHNTMFSPDAVSELEECPKLVRNWSSEMKSGSVSWSHAWTARAVRVLSWGPPVLQDGPHVLGGCLEGAGLRKPRRKRFSGGKIWTSA